MDAEEAPGPAPPPAPPSPTRWSAGAARRPRREAAAGQGPAWAQSRYGAPSISQHRIQQGVVAPVSTGPGTSGALARLALRPGQAGRDRRG
eukprot:2699871-Lingulodinium_polyedra.AAC.1